MASPIQWTSSTINLGQTMDMFLRQAHNDTQVDWSLLPEACRQIIVQQMDTTTRAAWRLSHHSACHDVCVATLRLSWRGNCATDVPTGLPSELLTRLPHLQHLLCCSISQLTCIQAIPVTLRSLDLTGCAKVSDLGPLRRCTALETLTLSCHNEDWGQLAASLHRVMPLISHTLQQFILVSSDVSDSMPKQADLGALVHLTHLQELSLSLNLVDTDTSGWEGLGPIVSSMPDLQVLDLSGRCLGSAALALAAALGQLKQLRSLQLDNTALCSKGTAAVKGALASLPHQLTRLDLTGNEIGPDDCAVVAAMLQAQARTLASLQLPQNFFGDLGMAALAPGLGCCTGLTELDLSLTRMSSRGAGSLAATLCRLSSLRCLRLSYNDLCSEGAAALAPALSAISQSLTSLGISNSWLQAAGIAALSSALKSLTAVTQLGCRSNSLSAAGAATLAPVLQAMTSLRRLNLSHNHIGAEGLRALIPAVTALPFLKQWDISNNSLGPEGAMMLLDALPRMSGLCGLWLRKAEFGGEHAALLKEAAARLGVELAWPDCAH